MSLGIEAKYGHVGDDPVRTSSAQAQLLTAASTNKPRTREMGYGVGQFALLMPHDHDYPLGERRNIVPTGAAVEIAHLAGIFLQKSGVDVAEAVNLQRPQKPDIDDAAMDVHAHDIQKTAPTRGSVPNPGIRQPHRCI